MPPRSRPRRTPRRLMRAAGAGTAHDASSLPSVARITHMEGHDSRGKGDRHTAITPPSRRLDDLVGEDAPSRSPHRSHGRACPFHYRRGPGEIGSVPCARTRSGLLRKATSGALRHRWRLLRQETRPHTVGTCSVDGPLLCRVRSRRAVDPPRSFVVPGWVAGAFRDVRYWRAHLDGARGFSSPPRAAVSP